MNKKTALSLLKTNNDSIVTFYGRDTKPIAVTTNFNNKWIKRARKRVNKKPGKSDIKVFDWTNFKYDYIPVRAIKIIQPLSLILNNKGLED